MNSEQQAKLRAPFDKGEIDYLSKQGRQLSYVSHARVTDRLLAVDPEWTWEPMAVNPQTGSPMFDGDDLGRPTGMWIKLTVGGVTRLGYGTTEYPKRRDGSESDKLTSDGIKMIVSDALRNAAMRFGVGLDLWTKDVGDDVVVNSTPQPQTSRGANDNVPLGSAPTVKPSPMLPAADNEASLLGQSIGSHEHDDGPSGKYIIKKSQKTGKLYAQCNGKTEGKYCNAFPAYGALDTYIEQLKATDVDPADVPELNVSVPETVATNDHHAEFIKAALDAKFDVGRKWITTFDNERLRALTEHIEEAGKVPAVTMKKAHYGDRADLSRDQLLTLADTLFSEHQRLTGKATQDEIDINLEEIPFE